MQTEMLLNLKQWIKEGGNKYKRFYRTRYWMNVRTDVMKMYHRECIRCRSLGKPLEDSKAVIVHHVKHVKKFPELADSLYFELEDEKYKQCLSGKRYGNDVRVTNNGNVMCLRPADFKCELFIDLDTHKAVQLLPLCRECHKIVHMGASAAANEKYPERW
ncbi:MAG: hypothetical protein NC120_05060 [Ruminococcus sp.]|nr:hypothetical protein [Ruminococcus sp.]